MTEHHFHRMVAFCIQGGGQGVCFITTLRVYALKVSVEITGDWSLLNVYGEQLYMVATGEAMVFAIRGSNKFLLYYI